MPIGGLKHLRGINTSRTQTTVIFSHSLVYGQLRTLYSLRHTAITFRLLYGNGIDLLTLARNARTSVEMIERFYSSNLTAEMNIEMLQSKRIKPQLI